MLFKKRIDRHFVSELDQLFFQYDLDHPAKSASQQAEINKANRVSKKRDDACYSADSRDLWENF